jgi:hypothetical protein
MLRFAIGQKKPFRIKFSQELQSVKEIKDVGFTIISDLSWSPHFCKIVKGAYTIIYLLFKAFNSPKGSLAQILCKTCSSDSGIWQCNLVSLAGQR